MKDGSTSARIVIGADGSQAAANAVRWAIDDHLLELLGTLIRRYDLITEPGYDLDITERLTMMPNGFRLALRRR